MAHGMVADRDSGGFALDRGANADMPAGHKGAREARAKC